MPKRILQIFRDGKESQRFLESELADGEQGNIQTIEVMSQIVRADRREPDLRIFVLREIVGDIAAGDAAGEVNAIFDFCQRGIAYRRDPIGVERVADLWSTMYRLNPKMPEGDCGIKSLAFATCCALLGHRPYFVVIKQRPNQRNFNHVYNAVDLAGERRYFDATPQDRPAGWQAPSVKKLVFPIF